MTALIVIEALNTLSGALILCAALYATYWSARN